MSTPEELLAQILKDNKKIAFGQTIGTNADGNCAVQTDDGSILARSPDRISAGSCVALRADDGQWYAVSARETGLVQRSVLFSRRNKITTPDDAKEYFFVAGVSIGPEFKMLLNDEPLLDNPFSCIFIEEDLSYKTYYDSTSEFFDPENPSDFYISVFDGATNDVEETFRIPNASEKDDVNALSVASYYISNKALVFYFFEYGLDVGTELAFLKVRTGYYVYETGAIDVAYDSTTINLGFDDIVYSSVKLPIPNTEAGFIIAPFEVFVSQEEGSDPNLEWNYPQIVSAKNDRYLFFDRQFFSGTPQKYLYHTPTEDLELSGDFLEDFATPDLSGFDFRITNSTPILTDTNDIAYVYGITTDNKIICLTKNIFTEEVSDLLEIDISFDLTQEESETAIFLITYDLIIGA